jgi:glycerol uptake facilitator-like aquaporin
MSALHTRTHLFICIVYLETVVTPYSHKMRVNSCFAIGFAYFIVHVVLITIDGCGVNPARSLGPAVLSKARNCNNFKTGALKVT